MGIRDRLRRARRGLHEIRRRVWEGHERTWVEIREVSDEQAFADAVPDWFAAVPGVDWARYNAAFGRVVVSHRPSVQRDVLVDRVVELERSLGEGRRPFRSEPVPFPGDVEPLARAVVEIAADAGGLVTGAVLRVTRARVSPGELDLAAVHTVLRNVPGLRRALDEHLGPAATDLGLALTGAMSGAMLQSVSGLVTDSALRLLRVQELKAYREAWEAVEQELAASAEAHGVAAPRFERPRELPEGPIEQYADSAVPASFGGLGAGLAASAHLEDALASIFGGVPKPARMSREAWASWLGWRLAMRGTAVVHPEALHRLDRIDVLVVDGTLLAPTGGEMIDVVPTADVDRSRLRARARELFDPSDPYRKVHTRAWTLGPLSALEVSPSSDTSQIRAEAGPGGRLLGLLHKGELRAIIPIRPEVDPHAEALVQAARRSELTLVACCDRSSPLAWAMVDDRIEGAVAGIAALQAREHGVMYLGNDPGAHSAADIAIGLASSGTPPWAADVVIRGPASDACALIDATALARDAARQGVAIAEVLALAGMVLAVEGLGMRMARRVLAVSNLATMGAMANGIRIARKVKLEPTIRRRDHTPWHLLDQDVVLSRLESSRAGLTNGAAMRRARVVPDPPPRWRAFQNMLIEELANPLSPVLATGAALAALVGSPADAAMVSGILGLNGVVGAVQRFRAEQAMASLGRADRERQPIKVIRDDQVTEIDAAALVPGDRIELEAGEVVPADCRILVAESLEMDESALTGESYLVKKQAEPSFAVAVAERASMLWAGTTVASGNAVAVVVAVGEDTMSRGLLSTLTTAQRRPGGVEERLEEISRWTTPLAALSGAAILGSGLVRRRRPGDLVSAAVALSVAAVPEGLPILATLAQLSAARRLAELGALVRNHRAVEALGRVDVLCADKTGTLTVGRMAIHAVSDGRTLQELGELSETHTAILADALRASPVPDPGERLPHVTDQALLDGAAQVGITRTTGVPEWTAIHQLPFEPGRNYHATLGDVGGKLRLCVKGSPEVLLQRCNRIAAGAKNHRLDAEHRQALIDEAVRLAGQGYRVLVVAERGARARQPVTDKQVSRLVFRGMVVYSDPLRPTAAASVEKLGKAGVRVVVITGDHPATGARMASELGLSTTRVVTGPELDRTDEATLGDLVEEVAVFARVTPEQKVRIVRALQDRGRIVAMTGDGANDAPAIRLADVGMALGQGATPAARQAADLVVLDERIDTVVDAILEGRALWSSVRKAVAMLVGGNLGEIGFTLVGGMVDGRSPLNARQLMLVNLTTDALPALALALQRPEDASPDALIEAGPEASLGKALDREIAWRAVVTAGATAGAWGAARSLGSVRGASTVALLTLVGTQLGQTLLLGYRSPTVVAASVGSAAGLLVAVQTPGLSQFFGCRPLGPLGLSQAAAGALVGTTTALVAPRAVVVSRALLRELGLEEAVRELEGVRLITESRVLRRLFGDRWVDLGQGVMRASEQVHQAG